MYIKCHKCGKKTYARPSDKTNKRGKYCSRKCYYQAMKSKLKKCVCDNCQIVFYKEEWRIKLKTYPGRFCSHKCYWKYRRDNPEKYPVTNKYRLKYPNVDKEILIKEYLRNKMTIVAIAKKYQLSYGAVHNRLKRFGIKLRSAKDYLRGNSVTAWAKRLNKQHKHTCQLCGWNKTICDIHHKIPLHRGGKNIEENLVLVCPNCHRLIHKNLLKI